MSILHAHGRRVGAVMTSLIIVAGALSGCAKSPNDVAVVDGTSITRSQVKQATAGAAAILAGSNALSDDQVISVMIQGVVAANIASEQNIVITDGDRDAKLSPAALSVTEARPFVYDVADANIVSAKIGNAAFAKALASADVSLNPRYGRWDPTRSVAVIADDGSLSQVLQQNTP